MRQTEKAQRPFERQCEINQRGRVERHRVPLRQERHAAVVVRIPKRQFAAPETFLLKMRERIDKKSIVARDESFQTEQHLRKRGENQQREEQAEAQRREPIQRAVLVWFSHEFCGGILFTKRNRRQVFAEEFAPPPRAGRMTFVGICEMIIVKLDRKSTRLNSS